ncbi:MAG: trehalase family glycosidase, partial [Chloroflexota bacterium]
METNPLNNNADQSIDSEKHLTQFCIYLLFVLSLLLLPVLPAKANRALPTDLSYSQETTWLLPGLPRLNDAAGYIPHTLSHDAIRWELGNEIIHGFQPNKSAQHLDIRDHTWSMGTAQYYYSAEYLREPIEAYLRRQYDTQSVSLDGDLGVRPGQGAIADLLTSNGDSNKQTITSDAEMMLIHAAYLYYKLTYDTAWLQEDIQGTSLINRLNLAAEWLYTNRFDSDFQLIWRGHTTAWGHIKAGEDNAYSDYRPAQDDRVASIYDQALAYMSLVELAQMNAAVGQNNQADVWQTRAEQLKRRTNAILWQRERGFYLPHAHFDSLAHPFDETAKVSVANALAIYAGLTDAPQNLSIFENLERVQIAAGARKPGLSIYPYYPDDFFGAVAMPGGQAQNGGIWDQWGGIQIGAEFSTGFVEMGQRHLQQVANDWQDHPGNLIAWKPSTDVPQEGAHYQSAAAGTMGQAIIEGFFGLTLDGDGLTIQPRLGLNDGFIRIYQPATNRYAAYRYDWNQAVTTLEYGTNVERPIQVKILTRPSEQVKQILLDGALVSFETEMIGQDHYVVLSAPPNQHTIELIKSQALVQPDPQEAAAAASEERVPIINDTSQPSVAPNLAEAPTNNTELNASSNNLFSALIPQNQSGQARFVRLIAIILMGVIIVVLIGSALLRRFVGLDRRSSKLYQEDR